MNSEGVDQLETRIAETTVHALRKTAYRIRQQMGPASRAATTVDEETGRNERADD